MKRLLLFLALCLSLAVTAQIPKDANTIVVQGITFKEAVNRLLDSNYTISKIDSNFQTVETEPRRLYEKSGYDKIILKVRIKDSSAIVTSVWGRGDKKDFREGTLAWMMAGYDIPVANIKQWQKKHNSPFAVMNRFALSFNKPVQYQ